MNHNARRSRLWLWRATEGLTQGEAAQRVGISAPLFREIETGRARPSERVAQLLEHAVGEPIDALLRPARLPRVGRV